MPALLSLILLPNTFGVRRRHKLFTGAIEGEDTELNCCLGELFAVAAVRRALKPGCPFDLVPVLYGKGGIGKSKSIRILAVRPEWYSDADLLDRDPERQLEEIDGVWIFELAELVGHKRRAEIERQKAFISRTSDRGRRVYERDREDKPRALVLIATSDKDQFLFDNNNRRFAPIQVFRTRGEELRRDRDQLWAEALVLEASFGPLVLPKRLWAASAEQQAKVKEVDPWLDPLSGLQGTKSGALVFVTNAQVHAVLGLSPGRQTPDTYQRVTACMVDLGWSNWSGRDSEKRMARGFKKRVSS